MKYLGIDVGGSTIKHAVMDETYTVESQGSREGRPSSHQEFLDIVAGLYEQAGKPEGGVAVSYCSEVDETTGAILASGSHKYNVGTNLKVNLEDTLGCRVSIENDGNCAALAELVAGSLRGSRNAMVIVVGTGLGGGIILDGKVYHGSHESREDSRYWRMVWMPTWPTITDIRMRLWWARPSVRLRCIRVMRLHVERTRPLRCPPTARSSSRYWMEATR